MAFRNRKHKNLGSFGLFMDVNCSFVTSEYLVGVKYYLFSL